MVAAADGAGQVRDSTRQHRPWSLSTDLAVLPAAQPPLSSWWTEAKRDQWSAAIAAQAARMALNYDRVPRKRLEEL